MTLDVQTSYPAETMEVRQQLLDASPYLSDTVMVSAVEKEDVLPNSIVTEVLTANPQSAKSYKVLNKLNARENPPNDNQMAQIHANDTILGAKELTEASLSGFRGKAAQNVYDLVRLYMNDTTGYNKTDSIISTLDYLNNPSSYYIKAFLYLAEADSVNVVNTLADVETDFELSQKQEDEHGYFKDYFNLLLTQQSRNKSYTDLDSSQMVTLTNIFDNAKGKVQGYARNLLRAATGADYPVVIVFPQNGNKSKEIIIRYSSLNELGNAYFKVYPNPAKEYISIEYNFDFAITHPQFEIITLQGINVFSFITHNRRGVYNIDLRDWKPGTYLINLSSNGKTLQSEKFIKF